MKGWIIGVYLLEDVAMIQLFKFIRLGILFPEKPAIKGVFIGFGRVEFQFTAGLWDRYKYEEIGRA